MKKSKRVLSLVNVVVSGVFLVFFVISLYYFLQAIKKPVTVEENEAADIATGVAIYTSPTTVSTVRGESFTIDLDIDTQGESVSGADLVLNYDKNFLVVNSIVPRDFFTKLLKKNDNQNGNISIVLAGNMGEVREGMGTMASVTFTALTSGSTAIAYSNLSQVAASDQLVNVLTASSGTTININGPPSVKSSSDSTEGSEIVVFASGTKAKGQYPTVELLINDEIASIFYNVTEEQKKYTHRHSGKVEPQQVRVRFINDLNDKVTGEDRNVKINKIRIDGKDYESEDGSTYSIGAWNQNSCGSGFKKSEWLYCNGEFRYTQ